jgi:hypothetical protein
MSLFDLMFLAVALAGVLAFLFASACVVARRRSLALRVLLGYAVFVAIYMVIDTVVSAFVPRQVVRVGEILCFDDWCITVVGVECAPSSKGETYTAHFHISSHAKRISQREKNLAVYLTDSGGHRIDHELRESDVPWSVLLKPGDSVEVTRVFEVPDGAVDLGLVIAHEGGFPITWFIIGQGPIRKPPVVWLTPDTLHRQSAPQAAE